MKGELVCCNEINVWHTDLWYIGFKVSDLYGVTNQCVKIGWWEGSVIE